MLFIICLIALLIQSILNGSIHVWFNVGSKKASEFDKKYSKASSFEELDEMITEYEGLSGSEKEYVTLKPNFDEENDEDDTVVIDSSNIIRDNNANSHCCGS